MLVPGEGKKREAIAHPPDTHINIHTSSVKLDPRGSKVKV